MFDNLYMLAEGSCVYEGAVVGLVPFLASHGYICPSYHNPADFVMEVACGEHGEAIHKLVKAVENGKCNNYNRANVLENVHDKIQNAIVASTSDAEPTNPVPTHDSVIVDIDLVKNSSNTLNQVVNMITPKNQSYGPTPMLLDSSMESVDASKQDTHNKNHISGFPTSGENFFYDFEQSKIIDLRFQAGCSFGFF